MTGRRTDPFDAFDWDRETLLGPAIGAGVWSLGVGVFTLVYLLTPVSGNPVDAFWKAIWEYNLVHDLPVYGMIPSLTTIALWTIFLGPAGIALLAGGYWTARRSDGGPIVGSTVGIGYVGAFALSTVATLRWGTVLGLQWGPVLGSRIGVHLAVATVLATLLSVGARALGGRIHDRRSNRSDAGTDDRRDRATEPSSRESPTPDPGSTGKNAYPPAEDSPGNDDRGGDPNDDRSVNGTEATVKSQTNPEPSLSRVEAKRPRRSDREQAITVAPPDHPTRRCGRPGQSGRQSPDDPSRARRKTPTAGSRDAPTY